MLVQIFNVDMASQNIPYEDEITEQGSEGHSTAADDNETPQPSTTASEQSSADSSDEVAKMEKSIAAMKAQLKSLGKQKKRRKRPHVEGAPSTSQNNEDIENVIPPSAKSQKIETTSASAAFTPRLSASVPPLRRAPKQHLRSAGSHLRSVENQNVLGDADHIESDPPEDDAISLLDGDTWSDVEEDTAEPQQDEPAEEADEYEALIGGLEFVTSTETAGPDISSAWAEKLKASWVEDNNLHSMKPLYDRYKVPGNCDTICAPTMNADMKRLMNSKWDKKTDITYHGMQKTLTKVVAATIKLNSLNMGRLHDQESKRKGMQITADIVTMLGQVNYELSNRRKFHLGKSMQPKYRPLCAKDTVKPTTTLFGDNVTQLIKDVNLKSKIGIQDEYRGGRGRARRNSNQDFLGFGRGRSQGRAPRGRGFRGGYQNQFLNQSHGQNSHHKKKN